MSKNTDQAVRVLKEGGVILYPTEGVYGIGCDPFNETAVLRLLRIKKRDIKKGLILIASDWMQVRTLIKKNFIINKKAKTPTTWVFPATKKVPNWIKGNFNSVAIRITRHPEAKKICQDFGGPIVSTSANLAKNSPIKTLAQINKKILLSVDHVVLGKVGKLGRPTEIRDAITEKNIRL